MLGWARVLLGTSIAALGLAGCGSGAPLPPPQDDAAVIAREKQAFVEAMKPRRAGRPVIAVLALNEGTEMTDLLLPHAVLQRAGVADVQVVAPRSGRVLLYPALQIEGAQDFAGFDRAHPAGADYVIVPAMLTDDDPAVTAWLRQQADKGARVIGVCSGALVLGRAGLLDGRRFAGHWYYRRTLLRRHPGAHHVPNQRYLVDRDVATTTGITASVPTMLALVEAIGGRGEGAGPCRRARRRRLGRGARQRALRPRCRPGLALCAQQGRVLARRALARRRAGRQRRRRAGARRGRLVAHRARQRRGRSASGPVRLQSGLVLVAQSAAEGETRLPLSPTLKPVQQLDRTLCEIAGRYGDARRDWVMQEMEYPGAAVACAQ